MAKSVFYSFHYDRDVNRVQLVHNINALHRVYSRRAAAVEVGLLNRDTAWVRWTLRDCDIWQTILLPGNPFVPSHLDTLHDQFHNAMTATRDNLAYNTPAQGWPDMTMKLAPAQLDRACGDALEAASSAPRLWAQKGLA